MARLGRQLLARVLTTPGVRRAAFAPLRALGERRWLALLSRRLSSPLLAFAAAVPRRRAIPSNIAVLEPVGHPRGTAVLLAGCVAADLFPGTNRATALLLAGAGVRVLMPSAQGCCGALPLHLGDVERARSLARTLAAVCTESPIDWVVSNAAGCGALLREYDVLLADDAGKMVASRARDALALLAELGLPPPVGSLRCTVAVHDPCHLVHGQGIRDEVRRLLAAIPGVELVDLAEADTCCGSAGTYNLTEPAMARRLLDRKLDHVAASGAAVIAAANPGCILQMRAGAIRRGLEVRIEHPIDLLAAAFVSG
jgi:glycolate oxidase iron-sulfur subunit